MRNSQSQHQVLSCGIAVVRGPDWVHGRQDGKRGLTQQGLTLGVNLRDCRPGQWALVRWKNGKYRNTVMLYRYGVESVAGVGKKLFEVQAAANQPSWGSRKPDDWGKEQILCLPKERTWVGTTIQVVRIGNIDTVNEKFLAKIHVDLDWQASGEDMWEYIQCNSISKFKPLWSPRLTFPTEIETMRETIMETETGSTHRLTWRAPQERHTSWDDLEKKGIDKRVRNILYITVTRVIDIVLSDRFEMESFPVDCQELKIILQSYDPTGRCEFCPRGQLIIDNSRNVFCQIRRDTFTSSDWLFKSVCVSSEKTLASNNLKNESYSLLVVRLKLQRKWQLYFFRVCIIMCLLSITNISSFFIPLEDIGDRMANNVGFVFTAIAFQFVINSYMPHISYLTLLDKYVLGVFIFMLMITFETCFIFEDEYVDEYCFWGFLIGIVLYHCFFIYMAWRARKNEKKKLNPLWEEEQFEHEMDLFINNTPAPCDGGKLLFFNVETRSLDGLRKQLTGITPSLQLPLSQTVPVPVPSIASPVPVPTPNQSVDQAGVKKKITKYPRASESAPLILPKSQGQSDRRKQGRSFNE